MLADAKDSGKRRPGNRIRRRRSVSPSQQAAARPTAMKITTTKQMMRAYREWAALRDRMKEIEAAFAPILKAQRVKSIDQIRPALVELEQ